MAPCRAYEAWEQNYVSVCVYVCERVCILGICENVGVAKKWHWTRQDQVAHCKKITKKYNHDL